MLGGIEPVLNPDKEFLVAGNGSEGDVVENLTGCICRCQMRLTETLLIRGLPVLEGVL